MKLLLVCVSTFAIGLANAQGGYSGPSSSQFSSGGAFNFGNSGFSTGDSSSSAGGAGTGYSSPGAGGADAAAQQGPQVFRYVSVHTAPEDPEDQAAKVIRVPGGNNKHVNIVFIKSPSNGADQKTEIVLPEQDEHKNLVYVLVQKTDPAANLKIKRPQPTKPAKPEVYFIRYKNQQSGQATGTGGYSNDAASSGAPSASYGSPSPSYGSPY